MSDTQDCPFCSQARKTRWEDHKNNHFFDCPICGEFLINKTALNRLNRGEFADRKPGFLQGLRASPAGHIPFIGHRVITHADGVGGPDVYMEYHDVKSVHLDRQ